MNMRKVVYRMGVVMVAMLIGFGDGYAQSSLAGQTYSNPNIGFNANKMIGLDNMIESKRDSLINVKEKELGRKLTAKETKKIDEKIEEGKKMMTAFQKAIKIGITINFKSATEAEMKMDTSVDDKVLKEAGVDWLQRNALKASFKMMPKSMKEKYVRKGNLIIVSPSMEPDTLYLSSDGKQLTGKMMKTPYTLKNVATAHP